MSLNDFVILQKLGCGSFATVYKARRLIDQKIYALKKIDLKALGHRQKNNSLNQIRLLACLKSPYIIGYCESFFEEKLDILCIAMEYADGGDLYKKIEKHKKQKSLIPEIEIWKIFIHLLYGLNELHSRSILHRDLKSQNVFIANQTYKIGDMNVSKIVKNGRLAQTQTGTPYYASPEVWNDHPYNQKSDIWSLGCILYEVTTLRPPFEAKNMQKLFQQINNASVPRIPKNYSKQLQTLIDHCLQKNPFYRPSTKDLLNHQTVKLYQNMLIEFKPTLNNEQKQNVLLKTIYMPAVKRELKDKLPQSNYKIEVSKQISSTSNKKMKQKGIEELSMQKVKKSNQVLFLKNQSSHKIASIQKNSNIKQALSEIQPILSNIQNLINQNKSQKKSRSKSNNKNHNKSKQKHIKNERSSSGCKRVQSHRIFKDKQNRNNTSKKDLSQRENIIARAAMIINSQNLIKHKPPLNTSTEKKKISCIQTEDKSILNVIEEVVENDNAKKTIKDQVHSLLSPKKLIFDSELKNIQNASQRQNPLEDKENLPQTKEQKILIQQRENIDKKQSQQNVSKQPYLGDTVKNISGISMKNHSYYNFKIKVENQIEQHKDSKQNQVEQRIDQQFKQPVNIIIDVNENYQKVNLKEKNQLKQTDESNTLNLIIGFEKIKFIHSKLMFKLGLSIINTLKSEIMFSKFKTERINDIHHTEKKVNQTCKNIESRPHQKAENEQITETKAEARKARSRSIPKIQKPKPQLSQNPQLNNILDDKITIANRKASHHQESDQKNTQFQAQSIQRQIKNNKEYDENLFPTDKTNQTNGKIKQMNLIPKYAYSNQKPSIQNSNYIQKNHQNQRTEQKLKHLPLSELKMNNMINSHQKSHKKIFPDSIFSQKSTQFETKKNRIFESIQGTNNFIHSLNDQIDRMTMERKIKKYINI